MTTVATSPAPNPAGWNKTNLTVTLSSTDNESGGTGVKQITYSAAGAQTIGSTTVSGATATINITTEGQTTITFSATDNSGNVEPPKTVTVELDKTPPTISVAGVTSGTTYDNSVTTTITIQDLNTQGKTDQTSGVDTSKTTITLDGQPFQSGTPVTAIGAHTLGVSATDVAGNTALRTVAFRIKHTTALSYTGPVSGDYNDPVIVTATLRDTGLSPATPVATEPVSFTLGSGTAALNCNGTTDQTSTASCSLTPTQVPAGYALAASFGGDANYEPSTTAATFTVTREETTLLITSSPTLAVGSVVVKAKLLEDGQTPISGRPVTFSAGSVSASGTTDSTGVATATLALQPGQYTLSAGFGSDPFYLAATAPSQTLFVYQPTQFVIWGGNVGGVSVGQDYTFWGSQWAKQATGGNYQANVSFKGYVSQVTGTTWTTGPGNSSNPPSSMASYIGVLVSTNISKQGDTISGNVTELVVLRVDNPADYQPDPGHTGTGVMLAIVQ